MADDDIIMDKQQFAKPINDFDDATSLEQFNKKTLSGRNIQFSCSKLVIRLMEFFYLFKKFHVFKVEIEFECQLEYLVMIMYIFISLSYLQFQVNLSV